MKIVTFILKFSFWYLSLLIMPVHAFDYDLSVAAIFQDEAPYLKEWIDYHRRAGVKHFWLYNNNSTDNYLEILDPYIKDEVVSFFEWPSEPSKEDEFLNFCYSVQIGAYNDALDRARGVSKWLALIDTDEFIVPSFEKDIPTVLEKHFSYVSGLCVNWQVFGTSNVKKIEKGESMLKKLVWKIHWDAFQNFGYKSIVQPLHVKICVDPHYCEYLPNYWHVNPKYEHIITHVTSVNIEHIRINHYWTRDEWFFYNVKLPRQLKWKRPEEQLLNNLKITHEEKDYTIWRFLDD